MEQSTAKSAFFVGYVIAHVPGGLMSDMFGGRWVLTASLLISIAFSIIIPVLCEPGGPWVISVCRFIVGLGQVGISKLL